MRQPGYFTLSGIIPMPWICSISMTVSSSRYTIPQRRNLSLLLMKPPAGRLISSKNNHAKKVSPWDYSGRKRTRVLEALLALSIKHLMEKRCIPALKKKQHLLYFVVKNHSFVDGNKRIGAFLFIWFLDVNGILYTTDGRKRIGDNALVALTLMIAESRPKDKDIIIKVIVNLINKDNI